MNTSVVEQARNINSSSTILFSSSSLSNKMNFISNNLSQIQLPAPNMCSSMISTGKNKTKLTNNLTKRFKQAIRNKLKKFATRKSVATNSNKQETPKLIKYNYKSYFDLPQQVDLIVVPVNKPESSVLEQQQQQQQHISCSCLFKSNSDGEQSFMSSSNSSSDLFSYNTNKTNELQAVAVAITSTPNKKTYDYDLDESTQIQVDSPVLIESTFNTSSCSNLSDDLIILQTATTSSSSYSNKPKFSGADGTLLFLNHNEIPKWALGPQLNLAVVNQHYFNQEAASEIFSN